MKLNFFKLYQQTIAG